MTDHPPSPHDDIRFLDAALYEEDIPVLPYNAILLFLAEGAANVLYRIDFPASEPSMREISSDHAATSRDIGMNFWKGKLLRLRKAHPHLQNCYDGDSETRLAIWIYFEKKHLVDQSLVLIHPGVVDRLNRQLKNWETNYNPNNGLLRSEKRLGSFLADDFHGLLVEDMSPAPGITLIEFKPKWLVQCPGAPDASKRCRTCAKRAHDNCLLAIDWKLTHPFFCPLDLMARDDENALRRAAKAIFVNNESPSSTRVKRLSRDDEKKISRIAAWVKNSNLLWNLRNLQLVLGSKNMFDADYETVHFRAAMTLRDCTMYLHVPDDETVPITAKIGDLELKSAQKAEHWKHVERYLVCEGWYEGTERIEGIGKQPLDCNLFQEEWTPSSQRGALWANW